MSTQSLNHEYTFKRIDQINGCVNLEGRYNGGRINSQAS